MQTSMEHTYVNGNYKHVCRICQELVRSGWKGEKYFYCDECKVNGDMEVEENILKKLKAIKVQRNIIKERVKKRLPKSPATIRKEIMEWKKKPKERAPVDTIDECYYDDEAMLLDAREEALLNYSKLIKRINKGTN